MKMRLSTPSQDMATEPKAATKQPTRSNTPSLDSAAGPTVARTKPTNPYLTPKKFEDPPPMGNGHLQRD
jgi:hypothetical protein